MTDQLRCSAGSESEYQRRTPERLVELLRSFGYGPRSWQAEVADTIERMHTVAQPAPDLLQEIHDAVNALGGRSDQDNSYDQGIVDTVSKVLDIIETRLVSQPSPAATVEKIGRVDREGGWNAGRDPAATVPARETVARILAHKMPSLRMANDTPGNYAHSIADEIVAALTNEPQGAGK